MGRPRPARGPFEQFAPSVNGAHRVRRASRESSAAAQAARRFRRGHHRGGRRDLMTPPSSQVYPRDLPTPAGRSAAPSGERRSTRHAPSRSRTCSRRRPRSWSGRPSTTGSTTISGAIELARACRDGEKVGGAAASTGDDAPSAGLGVPHRSARRRSLTSSARRRDRGPDGVACARLRARRAAARAFSARIDRTIRWRSPRAWTTAGPGPRRAADVLRGWSDANHDQSTPRVRPTAEELEPRPEFQSGCFFCDSARFRRRELGSALPGGRICAGLPDSNSSVERRRRTFSGHAPLDAPRLERPPRGEPEPRRAAEQRARALRARRRATSSRVGGFPEGISTPTR